MQIKKKAGRLACIRTTYIPASQRQPGERPTVTTWLGTMSAYDSRIPEKLSQKLTEDEKAQLQAILDERKAKETISTVRYAPSSLARLEAALDAVDEPDEEFLERIGQAIISLRKALRRAKGRAKKAQ